MNYKVIFWVGNEFNNFDDAPFFLKEYEEFLEEYSDPYQFPYTNYFKYKNWTLIDYSSATFSDGINIVTINNKSNEHDSGEWEASVESDNKDSIKKFLTECIPEHTYEI